MISAEAASLFYDLNNSPAFRAALEELVADQTRNCAGELRGHVQSGDMSRAQRADGKMTAFEDLPSVIAGYAKQHATSRV